MDCPTADGTVSFPGGHDGFGSDGTDGRYVIDYRDVWYGFILGEQAPARVGDSRGSGCETQGSIAGRVRPPTEVIGDRFDRRISSRTSQYARACLRCLSGFAARPTGTGRCRNSYVASRVAGDLDPRAMRIGG